MFPIGYPFDPFLFLVRGSCIWMEFTRRSDTGKGNGNTRNSTQVTFCFGIQENMYMVQDDNAFKEQRFPKKYNSTAPFPRVDVTRALAPETRSWTTACRAAPVRRHL
jgi:hypothetical protein